MQAVDLVALIDAAAVVGNVLGNTHHLQIRNYVVERVFIDVVNDEPLGDYATRVVLQPYKAVLV
jgi:hypothetical protein